MTNNEIRVEIAEICGWFKEERDIESEWGNFKSMVWFQPNGIRHDVGPPNYPSDLNAMHEAKKKLTASQCYTFYQHVKIAIARDFNKIKGQVMTGLPCDDMTFCVATARQEAEAFLRVFGKWKD